MSNQHGVYTEGGSAEFHNDFRDARKHAKTLASNNPGEKVWTTNLKTQQTKDYGFRGNADEANKSDAGD